MKPLPDSYGTFLSELKKRIAAARIKAALAVNRELVILYWSIGRDLTAKQEREGWGAFVIDRLAKDLKTAFPDYTGFSRRNLFYMRAFSEAYEEPFVQTASALIPWSHNCLILDKVRDPKEREWYVRQTFEEGWSHNVLAFQIDGKVYQRKGKAQTNFARALPEPQSDLAQQLTKDTYVFDFLGFTDPVKERKLEKALIDNKTGLILELGKGFAFIGRQYHLVIDGKDYYLDLLFYHVKLHCYVVIELKTGEFKPEYAGKMNFYLSAVDDTMRDPEDRPSIGIIMCRLKSKLTVEYALRDYNKPMGIAEYRVTPDLPKRLETDLPTAEELNDTTESKKRAKK